MNTYMDGVLQKLHQEIINKRTELVKQKLREKGYHHLVNTLEIQRFPKVVVERYQGWELYWADNGTAEGEFIVALGDFKIDNTCDVGKISISFQYQDIMPNIIEYKKVSKDEKPI